MARRFTQLAWAAAVAAYLLIVLGAVVRITGSAAGCGGDWPLCRGQLIPPFNDPATLIEWGHRQLTVVVSLLVLGLAGYGWRLAREAGSGEPGAGTGGPLEDGATVGPRIRTAYVAAALLAALIVLGAVTARFQGPQWLVVLRLGTALVLLAALLTVATGVRPLAAPPAAAAALVVALATLLLGALTAKLGGGASCQGFPLCNGRLWPDGGYLALTNWVHRLLAYGFVAYAGWWTWRTRSRGPAIVLLVVVAQLGVGVAMVLLDLPAAWRGLHVAVGTAAWAATVLATR